MLIFRAKRHSLLVLLLFVSCSGCGGDSTSSSAQAPVPDFSITVMPGSVYLAPGAFESLTVSISPINGFSDSVNVSLSGLPAAVSPSATNFSLSPGTHQQVSLTASYPAPDVTGKLIFSAVFGSLSHSSTVAVAVTSATSAPAAHAPTRTRYLRTNSFYDPNSLQFAPPHFSVYDQPDRRFFVSNPYLNRIDVFDAALEANIGSISVPGAWGIDISPDSKTLYAGTLIGDVFQIDPVGMQVTKEFPASTIGPSGFPALETFVLADGRLALLGANGGIGADGGQSIAIWNPTDNSIDMQGSGGPHGPCQVNIGAFAVSGDREKVLWGSIDSDGTLCSYNPSTQQIAVGTFGGFLDQIIPTPDGTRFFVISHGNNADIRVFDASTVSQLAAFQGPAAPNLLLGIDGAVLSLDGSTLYVLDSSNNLTVYNTNTLQKTGWVPNFVVQDLQLTIIPGAIDETGLIVGPIGHGVAFVDGGAIQTNTQFTSTSLGYIPPYTVTGPISGGTLVQVVLSANGSDPNSVPSLTTAYLGNQPLLNTSTFEQGTGYFPTIEGTTPSVGATGPADFTAVFSDNYVTLLPEGFSYGPTILEVIPNATTARGGTTGALFGYGLGTTTSDVHVTVGGQNAPVTAIYTGPPYSPYPFPIEALQFTLPPGTPGSTVDLSVSTVSGATTATGAINYITAPVSYPLPNSSLQSGIFDQTRTLYYFADTNKIEVLSLTNGWQTPFILPNTTSNTSLLALALSPDGTKLAVSDYGNQLIYVFDPDTPSNVQTFSIPQTGLDIGIAPTGLAVLNTGMVYFGSADSRGTGTWAFHKLNTSNAIVTDLTDIQSGGPNDYYIRVLQSPDGSHLYCQIEGVIFTVDTANDSVAYANPVITSETGGNDELSLSAVGSTLASNGFFADGNLNPTGMTAYIDWETFCIAPL